jgi:hypothetical protein
MKDRKRPNTLKLVKAGLKSSIEIMQEQNSGICDCLAYSSVHSGCCPNRLLTPEYIEAREIALNAAFTAAVLREKMESSGGAKSRKSKKTDTVDKTKRAVKQPAKPASKASENANPVAPSVFPPQTYDNKLLEENSALLQDVQALKTELIRMHDCVHKSLLAATAWMAIPESKRSKFITESMANADYIKDRAMRSLSSKHLPPKNNSDGT